MKLNVVIMKNRKDEEKHSYVLGVFSDWASAQRAGKEERHRTGHRYGEEFMFVEVNELFPIQNFKFQDKDN